MDIVELPLGQIIPYARNPRRNEKAVATVAASIAEFGWRQPIVVDESMVVLAGHTRLEAARQLGPHRLVCGDATVATDVERLMAGRRADLCFTDSPYNVDYAGGPGAETAGKGRRILNDALGDGFERSLYDACVSIISHTAGAIYMCMSSSELHTLQKVFVAAGGHWSTFIIWAMDRFTLGRSDYQRQFEPILYGWPEGAKRRWCGARDQGDVWLIDRPAKNDLHPTMKPVALIERALRNSSRIGDLVLDPFGGSGTTLIAAEITGRKAALLELDPQYVDVIIQRWQRFTGRQAVMEGEGLAFDEVKVERLGEAAAEDAAA